MTLKERLDALPDSPAKSNILANYEAGVYDKPAGGDLEADIRHLERKAADEAKAE